jgi:hypothetical protein
LQNKIIVSSLIVSAGRQVILLLPLAVLFPGIIERKELAALNN